MTKRATFTQADLARAAAEAQDKGVRIVVKLPDGTVYEVSPATSKRDPFDEVDLTA